jgi:hypothetical protein
MAEEKLRRKIRAEAALDSLSVGPPLAGFKSDKDGVSHTLTDYPSLFRSMRCFSAGLIWEGFIFEFRSSW